MEGLTNEALTQVASYFKALAEPTRLQILNLLRQKERNVGELAELCGYTSANVSRHLTLLTQRGLVTRESRGNSAYYSVADPSIYELCDLVCGSIAKKLDRAADQRHVFARAAPPPRRKRRA